MTWHARETAPTFKDYYQVLQLHPKVEAGMVDQAYWHLARLYRDAAGSDSSARAKLQDLNEAYTVLRSPALRQKYDKVRDSILGKGALPAAPQPKPEPLPLAVMGKQRPRPRENTGRRRHKRFRPNAAFLRALPWRTAIVLLAMLAAATPVLATGAHPALVIGLLSVGIAASTLLFLPRLVGLHRFAALMKQPKRGRLTPPAQAKFPVSEDLDALRGSIQAASGRWRQAAGSQGTLATAPPEADHPDNAQHAPDNKDSAA